jgi:hypothetical protein
MKKKKNSAPTANKRNNKLATLTITKQGKAKHNKYQ